MAWQVVCGRFQESSRLPHCVGRPKAQLNLTFAIITCRQHHCPVLSVSQQGKQRGLQSQWLLAVGCLVGLGLALFSMASGSAGPAPLCTPAAGVDVGVDQLKVLDLDPDGSWVGQCSPLFRMPCAQASLYSSIYLFVYIVIFI